MAALCALLALAGCRRIEPPQAAEARAKKALYERQIAGLDEMVARARKQGMRRDRVLLGLSEDVFNQVLGPTLPVEVVIKDSVRLRLEEATPYFRYSKGGVIFRGRLSLVARPDLFISVRLAGGIDRVDFKDGRLSAIVKLYYFEVKDSALGNLSKAVIEGLLRDNMGLLTNAIPPIEIPVRIEKGIAIKGLGEGPVSVKPGTLPFSAAVAGVLASNKRLWIALDVTAGPWKSAAAPVVAEAATAAPEPPVAKPVPAGAGGKP